MNIPTADQTAELWLKIDQLHLNFLKAEENTRKIDIRKRLEGFVHQYLCLVPQDRKFCHPLTSDIIWQSARWIPNFSALKAATAFEAIEKYAANLINQPWRKEFKEIKQYGGFYKHQVEGNLSGADKMFQRMGYVSSGQETMVLTNPPDQDQLTTVARDCVLAYVECQIVVAIMQGVYAQFPCTWEEVLEFRRDHVGPPEQAVRALVYMKNQFQYQMQQQPYHPTAYQHPKPGYFTNGYHQQPVAIQSPPPATVPTGKLVEVSPPLPERKREEGQWGGDIPLTIKQYEEEQKRKTQLADEKSLDSWDYVYRELESIGYTKDQADRPDVLELLLSKVGAAAARQILQKQALPPQEPSPVAAATASPVSPAHPPQREVTPKQPTPEPRPPPKSSRHSRPLQPPPGPHPPILPQKRRPKPPVTVAKPPSPVDQSNKWECKTCTFLNDDDVNICAICAKSRDVGTTPPPPKSGATSQMSHRVETSAATTTTSEDYRDASAREGSYDNSLEDYASDGETDQIQCGKCTLVNDARLRACDACGASLHIAPLQQQSSRSREPS